MKLALLADERSFSGCSLRGIWFLENADASRPEAELPFARDQCKPSNRRLYKYEKGDKRPLDQRDINRQRLRLQPKLRGETMNRLSLIICTMLIALAAPAVANDGEMGGNGWKSAPLVKMIREATRDYRDPEVAKASGYAVVDPWCISGPAGGATGVHFLNPGLVGDGVVDANAPEILVYEPSPGGKLRLVAVEYIVFADAPVALEGHLMNLTGTPNRFGIPEPFLRLHVWAWKQNPKGTFADYNPTVSCDAQPLDP